MSSGFNRVYPFTTENIDGYFKGLGLEDKSVLTVGSSGDQALNAITLGAGRVVIYDINPNTEKFFKIKRDLILNSDRCHLYQKVLNVKDVDFTEELFSFHDLCFMNTYLKDDDNYKKLQDRLENADIEFVNGDIFDFNSALGDTKFDRIIFSNILQYLNIFAKNAGYENHEDEFLRENFEEWIKYLNKDGLIQLLYYYCYKVNVGDYCNVLNTLHGYPLYLTKLDSDNPYTDAVVTYSKGR